MRYQIERTSVENNREHLLNTRNEIQTECGINASDNDFIWSYEENPNGKAISLMAKNDENGEYFGIITAFPRIINLGEARLKAAVLGEFMVKSNYRILGPALELCKGMISAVEMNEFDLVYGFPNGDAAPVIKRAGFMQMGHISRRVKIVRTHRYLRRVFTSSNFATALSLFADVVLRLGSLETWYRFKSKYSCEEISVIDERFEELWLETKSSKKVQIERSSKYLLWRFFKRPNVEYSIVVFQSKDKRKIIGYLVYRMDSGNIIIEDFVFPSCRRLARVLFAQFLRRINTRRSPETIILQMHYNSEVSDIIKGFGFFERKSDHVFCAYWKEGLLERFPLLNSPQSWLLVSGDDHV